MTVANAAGAVATPLEPPRWLVEPFVFGTPEQFARVREALEGIGFTEQRICERAGVAIMEQVPDGKKPATEFIAPPDELTAAIRIFVDGAAFPWEAVESALGQQAFEAFSALGLLTASAADPGLCIAPVALYPIDGVYLVSDRHGELEPVATAMPPDIVYSALTPQAGQFLRFMPRIGCNDYLELCSGSGIAALVAAQRFAKRAWGVDITERSTRFARFNAALNGLDNVTMLRGNLYDPVAGQAFDIITAHPPYVPALETSMVYRDGGEDGEQITRAIVEGLDEHLRPGGLFYCDCMITDRKGKPAEQRIREMLGPRENEFDIILVQLAEYDVEGQITRSVEAGTSSAASLRLIERFRELEVERFIGVAFLVYRRPESMDRPSITRRQFGSGKTSGEHLHWFLRWSVTVAGIEQADVFLDARPRHVEDTEFRSRSLFRNGRWSVTEGALVTHVPFEAQAPCPPWCPTLLSWCDGRATARDHLRRLREAELIPDVVDDAAFASLIRKLAGGGFIELDLCPFSSVPFPSHGMS